VKIIYKFKYIDILSHVMYIGVKLTCLMYSVVRALVHFVAKFCGSEYNDMVRIS
jgi:hypothetical protein